MVEEHPPVQHQPQEHQSGGDRQVTEQSGIARSPLRVLAVGDQRVLQGPAGLLPGLHQRLSSAWPAPPLRPGVRVHAVGRHGFQV